MFCSITRFEFEEVQSDHDHEDHVDSQSSGAISEADHVDAEAEAEAEADAPSAHEAVRGRPMRHAPASAYSHTSGTGPTKLAKCEPHHAAEVCLPLPLLELLPAPWLVLNSPRPPIAPSANEYSDVGATTAKIHRDFQ